MMLLEQRVSVPNRAFRPNSRPHSFGRVLKTPYPRRFRIRSGHRFYSGTLGRWINRDPIGEDVKGGLHTYTSNDPINSFDILGLAKSGTWLTCCTDCSTEDVKRRSQVVKKVVWEHLGGTILLGGGTAVAACKKSLVGVATFAVVDILWAAKHVEEITSEAPRLKKEFDKCIDDCKKQYPCEGEAIDTWLITGRRT